MTITTTYHPKQSQLSAGIESSAAAQEQHFSLSREVRFGNAWGLAFTSTSSVTADRFTYNSKELLTDLDLGWNDYGARMYMSEIGRWNGVDALAELNRKYSIYNYVFNNPLIFIDSDGMIPSYNWSTGNYEEDGNVVSWQYALSEARRNEPEPIKPTILSRNFWGAKSPLLGGDRLWQRINKRADLYYNTITIHHSGNESNYLTIKELQEKEQKAGYADIPYHFAIDKFGNIYEGRPINIKGSHVDDGNTGNIGIVLLADLDTEDKGLGFFKGLAEISDGSASKSMISSLTRLVIYLDKEYGIDYLGGHKELLSERPCPGDKGMIIVDALRKKMEMKEPIKIR